MAEALIQNLKRRPLSNSFFQKALQQNRLTRESFHRELRNQMPLAKGKIRLWKWSGSIKNGPSKLKDHHILSKITSNYWVAGLILAKSFILFSSTGGSLLSVVHQSQSFKAGRVTALKPSFIRVFFQKILNEGTFFFDILKKPKDQLLKLIENGNQDQESQQKAIMNTQVRHDTASKGDDK